MNKMILLDSGPLGLLVHRRKHEKGDRCRQWYLDCRAAGYDFQIPEIVDYELRRELLRLDLPRAVAGLDDMVANLLLPITSADLRLAAELWAQIRKQGKPTAAPDALDIDVLLAAQARNLRLPSDAFVVATSNVAHLSRLVPAANWNDIS